MIWWVRMALFCAVVLFSVAAVWSIAQDGERGLRILPWTVLALGALGYLIFPTRNVSTKR